VKTPTSWPASSTTACPRSDLRLLHAAGRRRQVVVDVDGDGVGL
jgi:hypothetical protein